MKRLAWFITPYGLGHAARAAAIMAALQEASPDVALDIITMVPEGFFRESLPGAFTYHAHVTDIGLVQLTSLHEDLEATIARLDSFLPFRSSLLDEMATLVEGCEAIVCDIAPLGIAVARQAGIPSILVENFTWDWIYSGYVEKVPAMGAHVDYQASLNKQADIHIQTEPVCRPVDAALTTSPVSRSPRDGRQATRQALGLSDRRPTVLVTMGGVGDEFGFLDRLAAQEHLDFVVLGMEGKANRRGNLHLLPLHSGLYHPDLIAAADYIVGKAGYSTIAEVYHSGRPFGYVMRPDFLESRELAAYIDAHIPAVRLRHDAFFEGGWIDQLPDLLSREAVIRDEPNGARQVAEYLLSLG